MPRLAYLFERFPSFTQTIAMMPSTLSLTLIGAIKADLPLMTCENK